MKKFLLKIAIFGFSKRRRYLKMFAESLKQLLILETLSTRTYLFHVP
ncbi:MAG: hypothetical protein ACI9LN_004350 [Saprospiraceae bacterium]